MKNLCRQQEFSLWLARVEIAIRTLLRKAGADDIMTSWRGFNGLLDLLDRVLMCVVRFAWQDYA